MIVGLGIDVVDVGRIKAAWDRFGVRFANRVLSEPERDRLGTRDPVRTLAKAFSVKEAAGKALGTGIFGPVGFHHIILDHRKSGRPTLTFIGPAATRFAALGARVAHVSISDDVGVAAAVVVLDSEAR